ncbi:MAG: hypothetical protein ACRC33_17450 [Gemmataceae bacterium]
MSRPDLAELLALFPGEPLAASVVPADDLPEPYRRLLVHEHHMTVTVEAHHGGPVDVRVLRSRRDGDRYSREILLIHRATGKVVQSGIVRIDLGLTSPEVRDAILAGGTPLGRVLIDHDVLREVEPTAYLRVEPSQRSRGWFGTDAPTYGRLAIILLDGAPAVEVLEVVAP